MPLNLASPGIVVREIDLTIGRTTPSSDKIGAIVATFARGPVDEPTLVENETGDRWLSASSKNLESMEIWNVDEYGDRSYMWEYR